MDFLTPAVLALIPVIVGLVQIVKGIGLNARYLPLVAVVLGIAGVFALDGMTSVNAVGGIVVGLSSVGLFSGTRSTVQG